MHCKLFLPPARCEEPDAHHHCCRSRFLLAGASCSMFPGSMGPSSSNTYPDTDSATKLACSAVAKVTKPSVWSSLLANLKLWQPVYWRKMCETSRFSTPTGRLEMCRVKPSFQLPPPCCACDMPPSLPHPLKPSKPSPPSSPSSSSPLHLLNLFASKSLSAFKQMTENTGYLFPA